LFGALAGDDVVELVGEFGEVGRVGRFVGVCGNLASEVGFLLAERFEARTVAVDALVAVGGGELAGFERFVVAVEFSFEPGDFGAAAKNGFLEGGRSRSLRSAASASARSISCVSRKT
jgi:hypothetical protein